MTGHPRIDAVLRGGRVIDPETGTDDILDVGLASGRVAFIGESAPPGGTSVDCSGLVVTSGFIDLHSHAQTVLGQQLQALDGVTTSLDLEGGERLVTARHRQMKRQGRPINYGYSASWSLARAAVIAGVSFDPDDYATGFAAMQASEVLPDLGRPASRVEVSEVLKDLERALDEGAIGIGVLLGYMPDTEPSEYLAVAQMAAVRGVGTFTHSRSAARTGPITALDAVEEIVGAARVTGASMHLCHVNSTSDRWMTAILRCLEGASVEGLNVSTEVYPYTRGATVMGAPFLTAEGLAAEGRGPDSLIYVPTGERIADQTRLDELRACDPGGMVMTLSYDEDDPSEMALMDQSMLFPTAAFASDAVPLVQPGGEAAPDISWPPEGVWFAHPRSAGCYAKVFRWLVRERGLLSLSEAIRRCSLRPAQIVQQSAPSMRRKGRLQVGMDADIVVFDPDLVTDRATYTDTRSSTGFQHVLVAGVFVVRDGELVVDALPGQPVLGSGAPNGSFPVPH